LPPAASATLHWFRRDLNGMVMEDRELHNLIKGWHARSRRESDPISRFVFLWFCFNAVLAYESQEDFDRQMLDWLKSEPAGSRLIQAYRAALAPEGGLFRRQVAALAQLAPIEDPRGKRGDVEIRGVEDFGNIVEGLYRVRCNLFHGAKRANDVRDRKLVMASQRILEKWVGNVLTTF
jgi:hypothetical protein